MWIPYVGDHELSVDDLHPNRRPVGCEATRLCRLAESSVYFCFEIHKSVTCASRPDTMLSPSIRTAGSLRPTNKACRVYCPERGSQHAIQAELLTYTRCRHGKVAATIQDSNASMQGPPATHWRLFTCRMPLIGLEGVATALDGLPTTKPIARLLHLHTYLLLESPNVGGYSSNGNHNSQWAAARLPGIATSSIAPAQQSARTPMWQHTAASVGPLLGPRKQVCSAEHHTPCSTPTFMPWHTQRLSAKHALAAADCRVECGPLTSCR